MTFPHRINVWTGLVFTALATLSQAQSPAQDVTVAVPTVPADSLPVFRSDSSKTALIQDLEAGKTQTNARSQTPSVASAESLDVKLHHRHIFIGGTLSFAFADFSALHFFTTHMYVADGDSNAAQPYEMVPIYFPVGLVVGIPIFPYVDLLLRTESYWYSQSAIGEDPQGNLHEFSYGEEGELLGVGARYLVPVSLLSVNGHPGLYVSYTQFWNYGQTGMYAPTGSIRAITNPDGAGYEVQAGFQQDFGKRWTWTGGLAFTNFAFTSRSSWRAILPDAPDEPANWTLRSLRLTLQAFYQFGISGQPEKTSKK